MNANPGVAVLDPIMRFWQPDTDLKKKLVIVIATRTISSKNIFTNGLYQNILFLYRLFRCLGHHSILLIHEPPVRENADILIDDGYEILTPEQVVNLSVTIDLYIEIGMSTHVSFIHKLREDGTRIVKLYLGNSLNIDCEMITSMNNVSFPHHTYSEIDEIWTSPHYTMNIDYLCGLYRIPTSCSKIAPYIWDSEILERSSNHSLQWRRPASGWQDMDIIISEANISYQKCALLPILLADAFYQKEPSWRGKLIIMNSTRLVTNVHLQAGIFSDLDIVRQKRVVFKGREDIISMLQSNQSAIFISHQLNNEFNYMTLELMWKGWPVLHNSAAWKDFGYYWNEGKFEEAICLLSDVMKTHSGNQGKYAADAKLLAWSYSMYNPDVQRHWKGLLSGT